MAIRPRTNRAVPPSATGSGQCWPACSNRQQGTVHSRTGRSRDRAHQAVQSALPGRMRCTGSRIGPRWWRHASPPHVARLPTRALYPVVPRGVLPIVDAHSPWRRPGRRTRPRTASCSPGCASIPAGMSSSTLSSTPPAPRTRRRRPAGGGAGRYAIGPGTGNPWGGPRGLPPGQTATARTPPTQRGAGHRAQGQRSAGTQEPSRQGTDPPPNGTSGVGELRRVVGEADRRRLGQPLAGRRDRSGGELGRHRRRRAPSTPRSRWCRSVWCPATCPCGRVRPWPRWSHGDRLLVSAGAAGT